MKRNLWLGCLIFILTGLAVYQNFAGAGLPKEEAPRPHYLAPSFTLQGFDGKIYRVGGEREKGLLLNFWASWCGPCELEAPELQRLYEKYQDRLDIYAVNATFLDTPEDAKEFVKRFGFTFPVLSDPEGSVSDLYMAYSFPTNFYIDRHGVIREIAVGVRSPEQMEASVKRIVPD